MNPALRKATTEASLSSHPPIRTKTSASMAPTTSLSCRHPKNQENATAWTSAHRRRFAFLYRLVFTGQAQRDAKKISRAGLKKNVIKLLKILEKNPYQTPPRYEKLLGDLDGAFSRRINIQHRLVYQIFEEEKIVKVIRMWTHYE